MSERKGARQVLPKKKLPPSEGKRTSRAPVRFAGNVRSRSSVTEDSDPGCRESNERTHSRAHMHRHTPFRRPKSTSVEMVRSWASSKMMHAYFCSSPSMRISRRSIPEVFTRRAGKTTKSVKICEKQAFPYVLKTLLTPARPFARKGQHLSTNVCVTQTLTAARKPKITYRPSCT